MKVEIFSDVVCPWCYVGQGRMAKAVERYRGEGGAVEVEYRPFQLDPDAKSEGQRLLPLMERRFGGAEQVSEMMARVEGLAADDGLDLRMDQSIHANSFDAHRLIWLAGTQGKGAAATKRFFRAYFTDGADIGNRDVLLGLAADAGVDRGAAAEVLDGDGGVAEVRADLDRARALGITGVPLFLFAEKYGVSGAQPEEALLEALREVASLTGQEPSGV